MNTLSPTVPGTHRIAIAAIWGGIGLFDATQTVVSMRAMGMHHAWNAVFAFQVLAWLPWALATPLILREIARHPLSPRHPGFLHALGLHVLLWLAVSLAADLWVACLESALNPWNPMRPPEPLGTLLVARLRDQWLASAMIYYCIAMAGSVLGARDRLAQQREESARLAGALVQAQLDALRHQVEPHFLFNALHGVSGLVREGRGDEAVATIARISDFLRQLLKEPGRQEVPLAEEIGFATLYLDIQKVRFADRLQVQVDVAPGLEQALVPRLILQPLVENAVKHGIARRAQAGTITIGAARDDERLVLTVYNDGPALPGAKERRGLASGLTPAFDEQGASIGLANVRERLRGLHGEAASIDIRDVEARGVSVSIRVPLRGAPCPT
jgi:two-component sensor histidine kinase